MNFDLTEIQQEIASLARKVLEPRSLARSTPPFMPATDDFFDQDTWKLLAKTDLLGIVVQPDEEYGERFLSLCTLLIEIGRAAARVPAIESLLPAWTLVRHGSPAQIEIAEAVGRGELLLSLGLAEDQAFAPADLATLAVRHGDSWELSGQKTDIGYARVAYRVLVPARVNDANYVMFLVDPESAGVTLIDLETSTGQPSCAAVFDSVRVPAEDVVGGTVLPFASVDTLWQEAATAVCALQLGLMEAAVALTVEYISNRKQFGRELATFQAVAMQAADVHIAVEAAKLTFWEAAWRLSSRKPAAQETLIAKYWAAASSAKVMTATQHLHGGMGVVTDYPLHAYVLWSLAWQRQFGSAASQLHDLGDLIAAELKRA